ncbi:MAG TPA: single-stranded-DNA-specific exonuclease RecJ [Candidatus Paceibacterota bacterium]|jgi:single-stranded-DNA-specific exonuclease|nr:single-stranded-DNA-specific exonuclease RecJ [Candidatus Paceibacterota bacterium]
MEISELVRSLLLKRGIQDDSDISAFLDPDYDLHTHDPFLLNGMDSTVGRIFAAIERNERIAVYADFDCDGIPGAALLSDLFRKIGYENFETYLPHRDREGYGFHIEAIDTLSGSGVKLIITVDVGTTAIEPIAHAKKLGIDVIVTDHHEITSELPECVAVLNPKREPYPFGGLCGAAVAYKLAQAILREGKKRELPAFAEIPDGWEKWLLDLVAIATVADMVPLTGENRALAFWGLQVLRKSPRPGISALCNKLRMRKAELTEDDIGFSIAPRINAASRMDDPDLALKLLTTHDAQEAEQLAAQLESLNSKRKGAAGAIVREAKKRARDRFRKEENVVVLGNPEWKPALLGLAANSVVEERGGVVCLWGRDALGRLKGSCRSDGSYSVVELFSNAKDSFEEFGGHARSGGFSVSHERVHELQEMLASASQKLVAAPELPEGPAYDARITLAEVSRALFADISRIAPFGVENPKPVFLVQRATVTAIKKFGKENNHVELMLDGDCFAPVRAYDFFRRPEQFSYLPQTGAQANVLATLERDTFRGGLALRLVDVLPA